ncbi:MAG: hypothetical protein P4M08_01310 [Oligoflexia bacterium]|nr:hypothetical protein [Oligoflexia bacterium]
MSTDQLVPSDRAYRDILNIPLRPTYSLSYIGVQPDQAEPVQLIQNDQYSLNELRDFICAQGKSRLLMLQVEGGNDLGVLRAINENGLLCLRKRGTVWPFVGLNLINHLFKHAIYKSDLASGTFELKIPSRMIESNQASWSLTRADRIVKDLCGASMSDIGLKLARVERDEFGNPIRIYSYRLNWSLCLIRPSSPINPGDHRLTK